MGIKENLDSRVMEKFKKEKPLRENRVDNIFKKRYYISPESIHITNYIRKKPLASFNPGALLIEDRLYIFPRLVFDYYTYNSSIGVFSLDINSALTGRLPKNFDTEIILWPDRMWEFGHGVEDPRLWENNGEIYMLYTGSKHYERKGKLIKKSVLALSNIDKKGDRFSAEKKGYFKIVSNNEEYEPECKDSAFIEPIGDKITMLLRFHTTAPHSAWRGIGDIKNLTIPLDSAEPVIVPMEWEEKVGWSTNVVKLEENRYLAGWHAVLKEDLSYKNGFALIDREGNLLGITDYLLAPEGLIESYGDRGLVIFGDGLVKYANYIIWIGGISDYGIGIFVTTIDDVIKKLKYRK